MANHFTISIPCKYYIKVYLENNCGVPVNLSCFPEIYYAFKSLLTKNGEPVKPICRIYEPETVTIIIPPDWFYRYGFIMNTPSTLKFLRLVEKQLKYKMRQYIEMNSITGRSVASCIRYFQDEFALPEPVWSFESIKKDFDRHRHGTKVTPRLSMEEDIVNMIHENLSGLGMKCKKINSFN
jgi:hypothetical protein